MVFFVLSAELFQLLGSVIIVMLLKAFFINDQVLHLDLLILLVLIVFDRVAECLVCSEFFLDHALNDSVMRELLLQIKQLLANLPLIRRFSQLFNALLVQLGLLFLGKDLFLPLLLFFPLDRGLVINIFLNGSCAILRFVYIDGDIVNEVSLAIILTHLNIIELE